MVGGASWRGSEIAGLPGLCSTSYHQPTLGFSCPGTLARFYSGQLQTAGCGVMLTGSGVEAAKHAATAVLSRENEEASHRFCASQCWHRSSSLLPALRPPPPRYGEVKEMADRIISMRTLLRQKLEALGSPHRCCGAAAGQLHTPHQPRSPLLACAAGGAAEPHARDGNAAGIGALRMQCMLVGLAGLWAVGGTTGTARRSLGAMPLLACPCPWNLANRHRSRPLPAAGSTSPTRLACSASLASRPSR